MSPSLIVCNSYIVENEAIKARKKVMIIFIDAMNKEFSHKGRIVDDSFNELSWFWFYFIYFLLSILKNSNKSLLYFFQYCSQRITRFGKILVSYCSRFNRSILHFHLGLNHLPWCNKLIRRDRRFHEYLFRKIENIR